MSRIGFDMGTTNSLVCYTDGDKREYLKFGNQVRNYFPTVIAYSKDNPGTILIGEAAQRYIGSSKYDVYENIKLKLVKDADKKDIHGRTYKQVASDFIKTVLNTFVTDGIAGEDVTHITATIPDGWKKEGAESAASENIAEIYSALGYIVDDSVKLESESVAAAAYFCSQVIPAYTGYLVVVDYGGGTLDMTLCHSENGSHIQILFHSGAACSDSDGCAGVAFDRRITQKIIEANGLDRDQYTEGSRKFSRLQRDFELAKIENTEPTTAALRKYYASGAIPGIDDTPVFTVIDSGSSDDAEYAVTPSMLDEAFSDVNEEKMRSIIGTMIDQCRQSGIDTKSPQQFHVLMAGGFSNLYCAERLVREAFESDCSGYNDDPRFDHKIPRHTRTTAIAHGAALIAEGMAEIIHTCGTEIGFYYYDPVTEKEERAAVIKKGDSVSNYRNPVFFSGKLRLSNIGRGTVVRLYFEDERGVVPIRMDQSFIDLCPDPDDKDNVYQIGFSIGARHIPYIHVRDKNGSENKESMLDIIEKIALIAD